MLTGIHQLSQDSLKTMLRFAISTSGNLMVFGNAGTGKTEMAMQAATEMGKRFIYLNLSVLEAPDLIGLPRIDETDGTSTYATPKMLPLRSDEEKRAVLLVDEIDKAKPELQNPMLELFQFRSMNGRALNIDSVIATGNLPDEGAFSLPVSHALTNRCMVFKVSCAFDPWREWAAEDGINPLVIGFLAKNQEFLLQEPPEGDDTAYCHPSPRAWTLAARKLDAAMQEDVDFQTMIVSGYVGTSAAIKFRVWLEHYRHIEPMIDALIREGKKPNIENMGVDRIMVTALAGVNRIAQLCRESPVGTEDKRKLDDKILKVTKNVFGWLGDVPEEFAIGAVKSGLTMKAIHDHKLIRVNELTSVYMRIRAALHD